MWDIPVLIYGSESWTLTRNNEQSLRFYERKVLQRIFGSVCENGFWSVRYNNELYEEISEPDVVKTITTGRLQRTGLVT